MPERLGKQAWAHSDAAIGQSGVGSRRPRRRRLGVIGRAASGLRGNPSARARGGDDASTARACTSAAAGIDEVYRQYTTRVLGARRALDLFGAGRAPNASLPLVTRPRMNRGGRSTLVSASSIPTFGSTTVLTCACCPTAGSPTSTRSRRRRLSTTMATRSGRGTAAPRPRRSPPHSAAPTRRGRATPRSRLLDRLRGGHVAFLDGSFRRHTAVSFDYVCSRGAI